MEAWIAPRFSGMADDADFAGKRLLVVGTGGIKRQIVFDRLHRLGLERLICLNDRPNWAAPYVDDWIAADPADHTLQASAAVEAYLAAHGGMAFDGVVTFDEYSVQLTSALAEAFSLPGIPWEVVARTRNKLAFRRFCRANGIAAPGHVGIDDAVGRGLAAIAVQGLNYPLVLKPAYGGGSAFVQKVKNEEALQAAIARYRAEVADSALSRQWPDHSLLVEEWIAGDEVDVDMLVQDGQVRYSVITDNFSTAEPFFIEIGGQTPSALTAGQQDALLSMAEAIIRTVGIGYGCLHFEAKITPAGPVPIEINLRLGGAEVYAFNRAAWGVDLVAEAVRIALGLPVRCEPTRHAGSSVVSTNFVPTHGGRIAGIEIAPAFWRSPALVELVLFKQVGDVVAVPPDGYDYMGWLVASGANGPVASENLNELVRDIHFKIV